MRCAWQAEIDPYCKKVLRHHWPEVTNYGDITKTDWWQVPRVDLICAGFPCQPHSVAGARNGISDPRWLWPTIHRAHRGVLPRWILLENVPGLLTSSGGHAFAEILGDLAESGYDAEWQIIPASAFGAPHRRERLFILAWNVAYADRDREQQSGRVRAKKRRRIGDGGAEIAVSDTNGFGRNLQWAVRERLPQTRRICEVVANAEGQGLENRRHAGTAGEAIPQTQSGTVAGPERRGVTGRVAEPAMGGGVDGISSGLGYWDRDWEEGLPRTTKRRPHRAAQLRALGNAVVPQVAEWLGRLILVKDAEWFS